jgi:hypothetical protein
MSKITEVAPLGKKAEEWIQSNKQKFKKQYGDKWEHVLYAKAWKMFGKKKLKEHKDPSGYVQKWKDVGFDITIEELPNDGKKFKISNKGIETIISEPETGVYKTTDGKTFKTFDDAFDNLLKNTFSDVNVYEDVDYLKKMAGIPKKEKTKLTENFSIAPDTIVYKEPNDISTMAKRLSDIENSPPAKKSFEDTVEISEHDDMTIRELKIACYTSTKILEMMMQGKTPERWNLSKITLAADYLTSVYTFMSSLEGDNMEYESLKETQLVEIFKRKYTPDEERIANDIYNMAKATAHAGKDMSPVLNPDYLHYINQIKNYSDYKDIVKQSWMKGFSAGRR